MFYVLLVVHLYEMVLRGSSWWMRGCESIVVTMLGRRRGES